MQKDMTNTPAITNFESDEFEISYAGCPKVGSPAMPCPQSDRGARVTWIVGTGRPVVDQSVWLTPACVRGPRRGIFERACDASEFFWDCGC
jgi:hypothetical protein